MAIAVLFCKQVLVCPTVAGEISKYQQACWVTSTQLTIVDMTLLNT